MKIKASIKKIDAKIKALQREKESLQKKCEHKYQETELHRHTNFMQWVVVCTECGLVSYQGGI
jgi:hypothetical protein